MKFTYVCMCAYVKKNNLVHYSLSTMTKLSKNSKETFWLVKLAVVVFYREKNKQIKTEGNSLEVFINDWQILG